MNEKALKERFNLIEEIVVEKINAFNELFEKLKKLEANLEGSKTLSEKVNNHIKSQQSELAVLVNQNQISGDVSKFIVNILENTRNFLRSASGDVERLYFTKQGELIYLQKEIDNLGKLKSTYEEKLNSLEKEKSDKKPDVEQKDVAEISQENVATPLKKKQKRVRPDQDPTTKAGRAAMDLAARRKAVREKKKLS